VYRAAIRVDLAAPVRGRHAALARDRHEAAGVRAAPVPAAGAAEFALAVRVSAADRAVALQARRQVWHARKPRLVT
jgi:hypothetical protein